MACPVHWCQCWHCWFCLPCCGWVLLCYQTATNSMPFPPPPLHLALPPVIASCLHLMPSFFPLLHNTMTSSRKLSFLTHQRGSFVNRTESLFMAWKLTSPTSPERDTKKRDRKSKAEREWERNREIEKETEKGREGGLVWEYFEKVGKTGIVLVLQRAGLLL